jgi:hypothetical protein
VILRLSIINDWIPSPSDDASNTRLNGGVAGGNISNFIVL